MGLSQKIVHPLFEFFYSAYFFFQFFCPLAQFFMLFKKKKTCFGNIAFFTLGLPATSEKTFLFLFGLHMVTAIVTIDLE